MLDAHFPFCMLGRKIRKVNVENSKYLKNLSIVVAGEIPIQYRGKL